MQPPRPLPSPFRTALAIAIVAAVCMALAASRTAAEFESRYALGWLYSMRGDRPSPGSVLLVAVNEREGERLSMQVVPGAEPDAACSSLAVDQRGEHRVVLGSPRTLPWPRCVHARMVDALVAAGARAVVFDMLFRTPPYRSEDERRTVEAHDAALAAAIRRAGRVITAVRVPNLACAGARDDCPPTVRIPPSGPVMESAVATGPMLLPSQRADIYHAFWLFDPEDFGLATLPLLTLHVTHPEVFGQIVARLAATAPLLRDQLPDYDPANAEPMRLTGAVTELAAAIRQVGAREWPPIGAPGDLPAYVADLYRHADAPQVLNEYGATGTLPAIGFAEALALSVRDPDALARQVRGRAVFIGYLQHDVKEPFEQFPTHLRRDGHPDVAGVEIAATAYANILDRSLVRPMGLRVTAAGLAGAMAAGAVFLVGPWLGLACAAALAIGIGTGAALAFSRTYQWWPLVAPLAALGIGWVCGTALLYRRERRHAATIRAVLARMLPPEAVARVTDPRRHRDLGYGLCLFTDAQGYTNLAASMPPPEIVAFLDRYFALLFQPVLSRGGFVSDVVGDGMLAIFPADGPASAPVEAVLEAGVAILEAVDRAPQGYALPTRIGVSIGPMTRTMVGALSHYEYRAVGDAVNVASRLQALNKKLGTRILVTDDVARAAKGFVFLDHGWQKLDGRPEPVHVHSLEGRTAA